LDGIYTHLGGGGEAIFGGVPRLDPSILLPLLSLSAGGLLDATEASADRPGSWIEAWLPCLCGVYEATVDVDDGREMSWPMDGSDGLSSSVDGVLKAGRSSTCRMDGLRKESRACGRGRIEVARAEAVVYEVRETLEALLTVA
jgi:hypothetical protein